LDTSFYENGTFDKMKEGLKRSMKGEIKKLARAAGISIENKTLDKDVEVSFQKIKILHLP
jgi:hypothetical protein